MEGGSYSHVVWLQAGQMKESSLIPVPDDLLGLSMRFAVPGHLLVLSGTAINAIQSFTQRERQRSCPQISIDESYLILVAVSESLSVQRAILCLCCSCCLFTGQMAPIPCAAHPNPIMSTPFVSHLISSAPSHYSQDILLIFFFCCWNLLQSSWTNRYICNYSYALLVDKTWHKG